MSSSRKIAAWMAASVAAVLFASPADAGGAAENGRHSAKPTVSMREGQNTLAPFAFIRYCVASPNACRPGGAATIGWSAETRSLVAATNERVNRSIRPKNEIGDIWQANVAAGDCEDFALTKRQALIEAGLPASALRMATAITPSGEGHAVLIVKTDEGDFVLDNRTSRIVAWNKAGLTWLKIASAEDPHLWRRLL